MTDSDKLTIFGIVLVCVVLLYQIEMIARDRAALKKQAIAHGYAEQIVENDQIVFKWKIPASATAELK